MLQIGPFRLDVPNQRLERDGVAVELSPKAYSVLSFLAANRGRLVTKQELLDGLWPGTFVQEGVLKVYIKEIRKALGDDAGQPRYIETQHRRGYRLLGGTEAGTRTSQSLPGRAEALARLHQYYEQARGGAARMVFITGEPGIGKTTLVETFLAAVRQDPDLRVAHGQCVEHSGELEPYLPFLAALGDLTQSDTSLIEILRRHAPSWLMQLRSAIGAEERNQLMRELMGANTSRMLRELGQALGPLCAERPLILVLEDLQWADLSTVELLGALARLTTPARFLLLATYRPVDAILHRHPVRNLKMELVGRALAHEIPLELLNAEQIGAFLASRLPGLDAPDLAAHLHSRTAGNPLFVANLTGYLIERNLLLVENGLWRTSRGAAEMAAVVPESLRQVLHAQFDRLGPTQRRILSAAAVAGPAFSTQMIAAMTELPPDAVEEECIVLAEAEHFLRQAEAPEPACPGSATLDHFGFVHDLYRESLLAQMPAQQKQRWHRAAARFGAGSTESGSAAARAYHYEAAGDMAEAIAAWITSAVEASNRFASEEGLRQLEHATGLLAFLPESQRGHTRLELLQVRARMLGVSGGEWENAAAQAAELGLPLERIDALVQAALWYFITDRDRTMPALEQALEISKEFPESLQAALVLAVRTCIQMYLQPWRRQKEPAFEQALLRVEREGTPQQCSVVYVLATLLQLSQGDYTRGLRYARLIGEVSVQLRDPHMFFVAPYYEGWMRASSGQWGEGLRLFRKGARLAEKAGFMDASCYCRLGEAYFTVMAGDPQQALAVGTQLWDMRQHMLNDMLNTYAFSVILWSASLLVRARLLRGEIEAAASVVAETESLQSTLNAKPDPQYLITFGLASAECYLKLGQFEQARQAAERTLEVASWAPELSYVALSQRMLALIALQQGDPAAAQAHSALARAALANRTPGFADWQVFITATRAEDDVHAATAGEHLRAMLASLSLEPDLRRHLLALPEVAHFLARHPQGAEFHQTFTVT